MIPVGEAQFFNNPKRVLVWENVYYQKVSEFQRTAQFWYLKHIQIVLRKVHASPRLKHKSLPLLIIISCFDKYYARHMLNRFNNQ